MTLISSQRTSLQAMLPSISRGSHCGAIPSPPWSTNRLRRNGCCGRKPAAYRVCSLQSHVKNCPGGRDPRRYKSLFYLRSRIYSGHGHDRGSCVEVIPISSGFDYYPRVLTLPTASRHAKACFARRAPSLSRSAGEGFLHRSNSRQIGIRNNGQSP